MNWHDVQLLKRLEDRLSRRGYTIMPSKYGTSEVGVYPMDDKNPIYSRDAQVFSGSVEQICCWIAGLEHQDSYLKMLKATSDKRIKTLEEKYIKKLEHRAMLDKIREPDKKVDKHVQDLINVRNK
jgi:hypothetical protein